MDVSTFSKDTVITDEYVKAVKQVKKDFIQAAKDKKKERQQDPNYEGYDSADEEAKAEELARIKRERGKSCRPQKAVGAQARQFSRRVRVVKQPALANVNPDDIEDEQEREKVIEFQRLKNLHQSRRHATPIKDRINMVTGQRVVRRTVKVSSGQKAAILQEGSQPGLLQVTDRHAPRESIRHIKTTLADRRKLFLQAGEEKENQDTTQEDSMSPTGLQAHPRKLRMSKFVRFQPKESDENQPPNRKVRVSRRYKQSGIPLLSQPHEHEDDQVVVKRTSTRRPGIKVISTDSPNLASELHPRDNDVVKSNVRRISTRRIRKKVENERPQGNASTSEDSDGTQSLIVQKPRKLRMSKMAKFQDQGGTSLLPSRNQQVKFAVRASARHSRPLASRLKQLEHSKDEITEEGEDPETEEKQQEEEKKLVRKSRKVTVDRKFRDMYIEDFMKLGVRSKSPQTEIDNLVARKQRPGSRRVVRVSVRNIKPLKERLGQIERSVADQSQKNKSNDSKRLNELESLTTGSEAKKIIQENEKQVTEALKGKPLPWEYTDDMLDEGLEAVIVEQKTTTQITAIRNIPENSTEKNDVKIDNTNVFPTDNNPPEQKPTPKKRKKVKPQTIEEVSEPEPTKPVKPPRKNITEKGNLKQMNAIAVKNIAEMPNIEVVKKNSIPSNKQVRVQYSNNMAKDIIKNSVEYAEAILQDVSIVLTEDQEDDVQDTTLTPDLDSTLIPQNSIEETTQGKPNQNEKCNDNEKQNEVNDNTIAEVSKNPSKNEKDDIQSKLQGVDPSSNTEKNGDEDATLPQSQVDQDNEIEFTSNKSDKVLKNSESLALEKDELPNMEHIVHAESELHSNKNKNKTDEQSVQLNIDQDTETKKLQDINPSSNTEKNDDKDATLPQSQVDQDNEIEFTSNKSDKVLKNSESLALEKDELPNMEHIVHAESELHSNKNKNKTDEQSVQLNIDQDTETKKLQDINPSSNTEKNDDKDATLPQAQVDQDNEIEFTSNKSDKVLKNSESLALKKDELPNREHIVHAESELHSNKNKNKTDEQSVQLNIDQDTETKKLQDINPSSNTVKNDDKDATLPQAQVNQDNEIEFTSDKSDKVLKNSESLALKKDELPNREPIVHVESELHSNKNKNKTDEQSVLHNIDQDAEKQSGVNQSQDKSIQNDFSQGQTSEIGINQIALENIKIKYEIQNEVKSKSSTESFQLEHNDNLDSSIEEKAITIMKTQTVAEINEQNQDAGNHKEHNKSVDIQDDNFNNQKSKIALESFSEVKESQVISSSVIDSNQIENKIKLTTDKLNVKNEINQVNDTVEEFKSEETKKGSESISSVENMKSIEDKKAKIEHKTEPNTIVEPVDMTQIEKQSFEQSEDLKTVQEKHIILENKQTTLDNTKLKSETIVIKEGDELTDEIKQATKESTDTKLPPEMEENNITFTKSVSVEENEQEESQSNEENQTSINTQESKDLLTQTEPQHGEKLPTKLETFSGVKELQVKSSCVIDSNQTEDKMKLTTDELSVKNVINQGNYTIEEFKSEETEVFESISTAENINEEIEKAFGSICTENYMESFKDKELSIEQKKEPNISVESADSTKIRKQSFEEQNISPEKHTKENKQTTLDNIKLESEMVVEGDELTGEINSSNDTFENKIKSQEILHVADQSDTNLVNKKILQNNNKTVGEKVDFSTQENNNDEVYTSDNNLNENEHKNEVPSDVTEENVDESLSEDEYLEEDEGGEEEVQYVYVDSDGNEISSYDEEEGEVMIDSDGNEVIVITQEVSTDELSSDVEVVYEDVDSEEIGSDEEVIYMDEDGNYVDADGNPVDYESESEED